MFVSQITWWVPHVFVWRSPKRSKMSSSAVYVPHTKYMWTSTWPGLAGFGVLSADSVHARPPYSTCRPGHLPRGGLCGRGCPTKPYFSRRPRGGPHIFYMADELILETLRAPPYKYTRGPLAATPRDGTWVSVRGRAQPRTFAVGTHPALQGPVCRTHQSRHRPWEGGPFC